MKSKRVYLLPGAKYRHQNGLTYKCLGRTDRGFLVRSPGGWVCEAVNIFQQMDGAIFWDFSAGGHWEEDAV